MMHDEELISNKQLAQNAAPKPSLLSKPLHAYEKQEYATPLFVLRETLAGFARHNILGLSASLSFYALFALIPLLLLMFFLLSHLVVSSDYAIVKLAILMGNLVPDLSSTVMVEVYKATQTKAAWGGLGLFALLWTAAPLAGAMRSAFYTIAAKVEAPSFFKRKFKNVVSVLGILLLFFLFTSAGFIIESAIRFLAVHFPAAQMSIVGVVGSLMLTTLLIAIFYKVYFPMRVAYTHLMLGALLTALLWLIMRPAFGLFLTMNQQYGAIFGGMKALFVSITWLYLNFAVFLLGTELMSTLRKKDVLLLAGLFNSTTGKSNRAKKNYIDALMLRYGLHLRRGEYVFERGNTERNLYYLVEGTIVLSNGDKIHRELQADDYFGEMAILTKKPTTANAIVTSNEARIIVIYAESIDTMLADNPNIAMQLLEHLAGRLQSNFS